MKKVYNIFYNDDLFEFVLDGTLVKTIRKYTCKGRYFKELLFTDVPEEVREELITKLINEHSCQE